MSGTVLEQIRSGFEALEVYEQAICHELDRKTSGQKQKVEQQHIMNNLSLLASKQARVVHNLIQDEDNLLKDELMSMKGENMFNSFYKKIQATKEYHQKYPSIQEEPLVDPESMMIDLKFSGEEVFGKYLDLNALYIQYCNIPDVMDESTRNEFDYISYLDKFNAFFHITATQKQSKPYQNYVRHLWTYLYGFFHKIQPLWDFDNSLKEWSDMFEEKWKKGEISGYKCGNNDDLKASKIELGSYSSAKELEALGMDRLKAALISEGLKCGGDLKSRAERLFSIRGLKPEEYPKKNRSASAPAPLVSGSLNYYNETARLEFYIQVICEVMSDVVSATRKHAEKSMIQSVDEKAEELYQEEFGFDGNMEEDEDQVNDDEPIYNPLNLPIGWDGKPIPYWLYKLHGLGVEFRCEICGNQSYWGRRAFDKHFQEFRHAHGMRCLGIPNTKHFHDITLIEDALTLFNKIKGNMKIDNTKYHSTGNQDEEFEDSEGNVMNRRTYEDLARQGLL